jgi:hypothetical protein
MANPDRKGGGGLSLQTLVVASAASLTAAMVTSRLFPPGTIYASALTPVIVAAVSEMLQRPAARASEIRRQRRMLVLEARERQAERVLGGGSEARPLGGAPGFAHGAASDEEFGTNGDGGRGGVGQPPPVRIHGTSRWGRIHPKVVIATGLAGFAIAAAALTLPELIFGGSVATTHRTTFFGGGASTPKQSPTKTQTETTTTTTTTTTPADSTTQTTPTDTQTTPTDTSTSTTPTDSTTQTTPTDTQTTPTDTVTSTTPAPAPGAPPTP